MKKKAIAKAFGGLPRFYGGGRRICAVVAGLSWPRTHWRRRFDFGSAGGAICPTPVNEAIWPSLDVEVLYFAETPVRQLANLPLAAAQVGAGRSEAVQFDCAARCL